ncbi:MAG: chromate transporter [Rikenellaceae bacterium]
MKIEFNNNVRLCDLFSSFLKVGLFTFGGGYAMIPLIEREVVERRSWVEKSSFADLLTIAQSVPGPIALNSAAFVGYKSRGYVGALSAVMGIVVPSFVVIMTVALFFNAIRDNEVVEAAFKAMRPVVVALIIAPTLSLLRGMSVAAIAVTLVAMAAFTLLGVSPVVLILGSIIVAVCYTFVSKRGEGKR